MKEQDMEMEFLMNPQDAYIIYQLKPGEETRDLRFESFANLKRAVERRNYDAVYTEELPHLPKAGLVELLETLYTKFNLNLPEDFTGHSLSVSDVIAIRRDGQVSAHYVDVYGFMKLNGFLRDNPLRNAEMALEDDYGMIDGILNNGRRDEPEARKSVLDQLKTEQTEKTAPDREAARKSKANRETER